MLVLLTVAIVFASVQAGPGPCDDGTNFFSNAASCSNNKSDTMCKTLFPGGIVENNGPITTLPAACGTREPSVTALCAKQCGLCCKQKEYDCENSKINPLVCLAITQAECENAALREDLAKWCPNVCGFCADNGCIDIVPGCAGQVPTICFSVDMDGFPQENCRKSCDLCNTPMPTKTAPTTTAKPAAPTPKPAVTTPKPALTSQKAPVTTRKAPAPAEPCVDRDQRCPTTFKNVCTEPFYINNSDPKIRPEYLCRRTCGFCR